MKNLVSKLNTIYSLRGRSFKAVLKNRRAMFVLLPFVLYGIFAIYQNYKVNEIYASDPLVITYDGMSPPDPMFEVFNMLPGDETEKTFNVLNDSSESEGVTMDAVKTEELKNFAGILDVVITELPATVVFSGKLQDFFDLPPQNLGAFPPAASKDYKVYIKFPESAGNEYQQAKVVFNIIWQTEAPPIELPPECAHLAGTITSVIEGTEGNDKIHGNVQGNLILAKGGNDKVDASSGNDCVVLGDGNDQVDSESGNDVVIGGAGNDKIDTGSGNDHVYGGDGNDNIELGTGDDKAWGGEGNDSIDGGSNDDEIHGGSGNDTIRGGSGNDQLFGDGDNDNIRGDSGNDVLDGGADHDTLNGNSGTDACLFGETNISCEI